MRPHRAFLGPLGGSAILLLPMLAACSGALAEGDGRAFGDDLGRFRVTANMETNTCGEGALDAPAHWEFDVVLSHDKQHFYWNTGADAVRGTLSDDGKSFTLHSTTTIADGDADPCGIERTDGAQGVLDHPDRARTLRGSLTYAFARTNDSACAATGLPPDGSLSKLPCRMGYRMTAEWISMR